MYDSVRGKIKYSNIKKIGWFDVLHNCQVWSDNRGELFEWFSDVPATKGFIPVQTNVSKSVKGVLRGIH